MSERCGRCGADPAEGFATIGDTRYCHEGPDPTCYQLASWGVADPADISVDSWAALLDVDPSTIREVRIEYPEERQ